MRAFDLEAQHEAQICTPAEENQVFAWKALVDAAFPSVRPCQTALPQPAAEGKVEHMPSALPVASDFERGKPVRPNYTGEALGG